jgi:hypothetical protein
MPYFTGLLALRHINLCFLEQAVLLLIPYPPLLVDAPAGTTLTSHDQLIVMPRLTSLRSYFHKASLLRHFLLRLRAQGLEDLLVDLEPPAVRSNSEWEPPSEFPPPLSSVQRLEYRITGMPLFKTGLDLIVCFSNAVSFRITVRNPSDLGIWAKQKPLEDFLQLLFSSLRTATTESNENEVPLRHLRLLSVKIGLNLGSHYDLSQVNVVDLYSDHEVVREMILGLLSQRARLGAVPMSLHITSFSIETLDDYIECEFTCSYEADEQ